MTVSNVAGFNAAFRTAMRLGPERTIVSRLRTRVESFLSSGDLAFEKNYLIVRPAIAIAVIIAVTVPGSLPGRNGVIIAASAAIAYNFLLAYFIFNKRMYMLRAVSLIFDNSTVMAASLFVFMRMGRVGYETDLWLIYVTLIVSSSLYYGPIGSLFFTTLWTGLFVGVSLGFYDGDTYFRHQLPMRLVFFVLHGLRRVLALRRTAQTAREP